MKIGLHRPLGKRLLQIVQQAILGEHILRITPCQKLIRPVHGFKTLKTAHATINGFEVMHALHKVQAAIFNLTDSFERDQQALLERRK